MGLEETKERNVYVPILKQTPLFRTLTEDEILAVLAHCVKRSYAAGETILTEGETGNSMLIIVEGSVDYSKGLLELGSDTDGAFFGEIALLAEGIGKRQATVKATKDCVLLEIYQPSFRDLLRNHPEIGTMVIETLATRIQAASPPPVMKSKLGFVLASLLVPALAAVLAKYLPKEVAGETAALLVGQLEVVLVPLLAGLGFVARHLEAKATQKALSGRSRK